MNWAMPARPYLSPQLPVEGISGRVVNMDPKPLSSLQGPPILDSERIKFWPLNVPTSTYSHNHQVDAEVRS
jgi:hypothetical protein